MSCQRCGCVGEDHVTIVSLRSQLAAAEEREARLREALGSLRWPGRALSNVCFNLSQCVGHPLTKENVANMKEAQLLWDKAWSAALAPPASTAARVTPEDFEALAQAHRQTVASAQRRREIEAELFPSKATAGRVQATLREKDLADRELDEVRNCALEEAARVAAPLHDGRCRMCVECRERNTIVAAIRALKRSGR